MLEAEIAPYSEAHMAAIEQIHTEISEILDSPQIELSDDLRAQMEGWSEELVATHDGFARLTACALDVWKQKNRAQRYLEVLYRLKYKQ